ncbi:T9SS type A sorting domain-containing protein, partial [bacterium]|nr:T9SS type A sorting domain-containing protein [bacterium]
LFVQLFFVAILSLHAQEDVEIQKVKRVDLQLGDAVGMVKVEDYLYVAYDLVGLAVIHIDQNGESEIVAKIYTEKEPRYLGVYQNALYFFAERSIHIYDISDRGNPISVREMPTDRRIYGYEIDNEKLYLSFGANTEVYDLETPLEPILIGTGILPRPTFKKYLEDYIVVTIANERVEIYEIVDDTTFVRLDRLTMDLDIKWMHVYQNTLYISSRNQILAVALDNHEELSVIGEATYPDHYNIDFTNLNVHSDSGILAVAYEYRTYFFDLSEPANPRSLCEPLQWHEQQYSILEDDILYTIYKTTDPYSSNLNLDRVNAHIDSPEHLSSQIFEIYRFRFMGMNNHFIVSDHHPRGFNIYSLPEFELIKHNNYEDPQLHNKMFLMGKHRRFFVLQQIKDGSTLIGYNIVAYRFSELNELETLSTITLDHHHNKTIIELQDSILFEHTVTHLPENLELIYELRKYDYSDPYNPVVVDEWDYRFGRFEHVDIIDAVGDMEVIYLSLQLRELNETMLYVFDRTGDRLLLLDQESAGVYFKGLRIDKAESRLYSNGWLKVFDITHPYDIRQLQCSLFVNSSFFHIENNLLKTGDGTPLGVQGFKVIDVSNLMDFDVLYADTPLDRFELQGSAANEKYAIMLEGNHNQRSAFINIYEDVNYNSRKPSVEDNLPTELEILSCYPNPTNSSLQLTYNLSDAKPATIQIYNLSGQLVFEQKTNPSSGLNEFTWNGTNSEKLPISSGMYLLKISTEQESVKKKVVLLK